MHKARCPRPFADGCSADFLPDGPVPSTTWYPISDNYVVAPDNYVKRQTPGMCTRCGNLYEPACEGANGQPLCFPGMYSSEVLVPAEVQPPPPFVLPCATVTIALECAACGSCQCLWPSRSTANNDAGDMQDGLCVPEINQVGCGTHGKPLCPPNLVEQLGTLALMIAPSEGNPWDIVPTLYEREGCLFSCAAAALSHLACPFDTSRTRAWGYHRTATALNTVTATTAIIWQTAPEQCCEYCPRTAPGIVRLSGALGHSANIATGASECRDHNQNMRFIKAPPAWLPDGHACAELCVHCGHVGEPACPVEPNCLRRRSLLDPYSFVDGPTFNVCPCPGAHRFACAALFFAAPPWPVPVSIRSRAFQWPGKTMVYTLAGRQRRLPEARVRWRHVRRPPCAVPGRPAQRAHRSQRRPGERRLR